MTDTPAIEHPDQLRNGDFTEASEPLMLFAAWMEEAKRSEPNDPNAMALATADGDGFPDVRMVLLKGFDEAGFVFFTNLESAKARELRERPQAALVFHWKSLRRQVRVRGNVTPVSDAEADAYFATQAAARADRRLGEQAIVAAGEPAGLRSVGGTRHRALPAWRYSKAALLVGLSRRPARDRILA